MSQKKLNKLAKAEQEKEDDKARTEDYYDYLGPLEETSNVIDHELEFLAIGTVF